MKIPHGADEIIKARKRGFKPASMLIVSLVGKVNETNPMIHANPASEYDWRWIVGLDVCIYVNQKTNWRPITMQIARCQPHWLGIYDQDAFEGAHVWALPLVDDIEKPKSQWRWRLDLLPWLKFENEQFAWGD